MSQHSPLHRLRELVHIEREDIGTLLAYGIGIGLMSLAMPVAVQALVNTIAFGALLQPLIVLTLILLVLLSFSNTLVALQFYVVEMLQRRLFVRLFGEAANRLQRASISVRDRQYLPELANRFFDVVSLQKTAASLLLETLGYVMQTLIGMILLAFYHPILLAFDLFLIASLYVILFVMGKRGIPTVIEQSRAKYVAAAWLESIAANPLLGKSQQGAAFVHQHTERIAQDYLQASKRHFDVLSKQNIGALTLHTLANTALLGMGGWMVIERQLSLGQLIAAELVVNAMVYGLTRLGKTLDNFYELLASLDKIGYLIDLSQERDAGSVPKPQSTAFKLEIRQLSIAEAPQHDRFDGIDLQLAAGSSLAISAGCEHGTLLDVLYGLRAPNTGQILLDDQDLRDLKLGAIRDHIALLRHAEVLELSISDNLSLGRASSLAEIRTALDRVGLLDAVSALPEGLNTRLSLHGAPLSHEQCLRLTMARAFAAKPRLLLIDQLLDRLDPRCLPRILDTLFNADAPWTSLIITHEPSLIERCHEHRQLKDGRWVIINNPTGATS